MFITLIARPGKADRGGECCPWRGAAYGRRDARADDRCGRQGHVCEEEGEEGLGRRLTNGQPNADVDAPPNVRC